MPGLCYVCITVNASLNFFFQTFPSPVITTYCSLWELLESPAHTVSPEQGVLVCFWNGTLFDNRRVLLTASIWNADGDVVCWLLVFHAAGKCLSLQGVLSGTCVLWEQGFPQSQNNDDIRREERGAPVNQPRKKCEQTSKGRKLNGRKPVVPERYGKANKNLNGQGRAAKDWEIQSLGDRED